MFITLVFRFYGLHPRNPWITTHLLTTDDGRLTWSIRLTYSGEFTHEVSPVNHRPTSLKMSYATDCSEKTSQITTLFPDFFAFV